MEIAIRARDVGWSEELRQQVERSIEFAIDRHKSRIDRISVYLSDLNGPRGGVDNSARSRQISVEPGLF